jgi:hypothetical protein
MSSKCISFPLVRLQPLENKDNFKNFPKRSHISGLYQAKPRSRPSLQPEDSFHCLAHLSSTVIGHNNLKTEMIRMAEQKI